MTGAVFWAEVWRRVCRTSRSTDASPHITAVFLNSYKLQKTVTVILLLLSGHVTLSCFVGHLLYIVEWRTSVVVRLSDWHAPTLLCSGAIQTGSGCQCSVSDTTSRGTSALQRFHPSLLLRLTLTLTQRRVRRISAGSPHSKDSVNGARDTTLITWQYFLSSATAQSSTIWHRFNTKYLGVCQG